MWYNLLGQGGKRVDYKGFCQVVRFPSLLRKWQPIYEGGINVRFGSFAD
jgi:hypothetical protein